MGLALAVGVPLLQACGDDSSSGSGKPSATSPTSAPSANTYQLSAALDTHQVVTPANKTWTPPAGIADATGTFSGVIDTRTGILDWQLDYTGLGKPALPIADIHLGQRGRFGAVLVRLCGPCKASDSGTVQVKPPARSVQLTSGNTWVTLLIDKYPNGAIRGQITAK